MKISHTLEGCKSEHCNCDITYKLLPSACEEYEKTIKRYDGLKRRPNADMFKDFINEVSVLFDIKEGVISRMKGDPKLLRAMTEAAYRVAQNQVPIPAPFVGNLPKTTSWKANSTALDFYQEWDIKYFTHYVFKGNTILANKQYWIDNIWLVVHDGDGIVRPGIEWDAPSPTLFIKALRGLSFYNKAFAGTVVDKIEGGVLHKVKYSWSNYSQENLYPEKIIKLINKYDKPTQKMPYLMDELKEIIPQAIAMLAEDAGWKDMYGKYKWILDKVIDECLHIPMKTAAGCRPGPRDRVVSVANGIKRILTVNGKKFDQVLLAAKDVDEYIRAIRAGLTPLFKEVYNRIVVKSEIQLAASALEEDLKKAEEKAREFFIPNLSSILIAQLVQGFRQKIERGDIIRIGLDWSRGGMYHFAKYFRYFDHDMRYITFDISAFDTSVVATLLELYSQFARVYVSDDSEWYLFDKLLDESTKRLTYKVTQIMATVWRIIIGCMPSGAYETSHGDSWITAMVYYAFFVYLCMTDMEFRELFMQFRKEKKHPLSVYGDDNVLGFHYLLLKWYTKDNITWFFKAFAGFVLRDFKIHSQFLSTLTPFGEIRGDGIVFLQKYAIKTPQKFRELGAPDIVHARPAEISIRKFAKGSGDYRTDLDYYLSAVSGVWDNPCNQVWQDFCRLAVDFFKPHDISLDDYQRMILRSDTYITKMMKKHSLCLDDLLEGLPTTTKIATKLAYDESHHINKKVNDLWTSDLFRQSGGDYYE